jgi:hypothetical protein
LTYSSNEGGQRRHIPAILSHLLGRVVLNCPFEEVLEETSCNREEIGVPTSNKINGIAKVRVRRSNSIYLKELEYD